MANQDNARPTQLSSLDHSCIQFEFWLCVVVIGVLCVLGVTGNVTSFIVLWKHQTDSATVYLLQVLAVSDSILLLTSFIIYSLSPVYPYTGRLETLYINIGIVQKYIWPVSLMAHTTTVWTTVLVTLNRYYAVCLLVGPFRSYVLQATKLQIIAVVAFSVIYNTPRFFEHHAIYTINYPAGSSNETNCTTIHVNLGDSKIYQIIYSNVIYFPVMYIFPLISLTYLNSRLLKSMNNIRIKKQMLTSHKIKDDHITVIIVVIVFIFIICQTPAMINQIFWATTSKDDRQCGQFHFYYTKVSDALVIMNSSCNFVIYVLFGKTFRRVFVTTLCRKNIYRQRPDDPSSQPLQEL